MKVVLQRVKEAKVTIQDQIQDQIQAIQIIQAIHYTTSTKPSKIKLTA